MGGELRYLDPGVLRFHRHGAVVRLTVGEDCSYLRVTVLRCFPLSSPGRHLSVRDGANKEIGVIVDPARLDEVGRAIVAEELARRYVLPVILAIHAARERFGSVEWKVTTDRGERTFTTTNLRESILTPAPGRYILADVDGSRYDVPSIVALPSSSRSLLMRNL